MTKWIFVFSGLIFLFSCSHKEQFPKLKSEKAGLNQVRLTGNLSIQFEDSIAIAFYEGSADETLKLLNEHQQQYFQKDAAFDFDKFIQEWTNFNSSSEQLILTPTDKATWFEINGTLLQITGEAKYAEEMEQILQTGFPEIVSGNSGNKDFFKPYIFTKNADHIFVNLFTPAEITYNHTLGGEVKIRQEFPQNQPDSIYINFELEERRYIELYVRIPSWAEGATVTVKKVKYFARPGEYCQIAKKWKTGDVVEIYFPKDKHH